MSQSFSTLSVSDDLQHIIVLRLNRASVCNAINFVMMQELLSFWRTVSASKQLRAVIITGEGEKAFCAGADLKERNGMSLSTWQSQHAVLQQAMLAMIQCPLPIIAAVNGVAYGGGLELVLASDFAYCAEHAVFSQSEVKLGIMPGAMGTQNLPRAVGLRRSKELTFTGEAFTAQQALSWGVVNQVVPADQLQNAVVNTAQKITRNAPIAVRQAKRSINQAWATDIAAGYRGEVDAYNQLLATSDRVEGIRAFNEKRMPDFSGE